MGFGAPECGAESSGGFQRRAGRASLAHDFAVGVPMQPAAWGDFIPLFRGGRTGIVRAQIPSVSQKMYTGQRRQNEKTCALELHTFFVFCDGKAKIGIKLPSSFPFSFLLFKTGIHNRFFNSPISFLRKRELRINPTEILSDILRIRVFAEIALSLPDLNGTVILSHAVLQMEKVNISFEVNKQIKKSLVGPDDRIKRAVVVFIVPPDTFQSKIPTVSDERMASFSLVHTVGVFRKDNGSADRICSMYKILCELPIIRQSFSNSSNQIAAFAMPEADNDGIASKSEILPCQIIRTFSGIQIHCFTVGESFAPKQLMILLQHSARSIWIRHSSTHTAIVLPEVIPVVRTVSCKIKRSIKIHFETISFFHESDKDCSHISDKRNPYTVHGDSFRQEMLLTCNWAVPLFMAEESVHDPVHVDDIRFHSLKYIEKAASVEGRSKGNVPSSVSFVNSNTADNNVA